MKVTLSVVLEASSAAATALEDVRYFSLNDTLFSPSVQKRVIINGQYCLFHFSDLMMTLTSLWYVGQMFSTVPLLMLHYALKSYGLCFVVNRQLNCKVKTTQGITHNITP